MERIPNAQVPLLQPDGTLTLPWRLFFQNLGTNSGPVSDIVAGNGLTIANAGTISLETPVSVPDGGTGTDSASLDGGLLIGNAASGVFDLAQLTAGTNITITNGHGTIEIASGTGGGTPIGFGFNAGGLMQSGENLGTPVWGHPRVFSGTPFDIAVAKYGATLNSTFTLVAYPSGSPVVAGTINFNRDRFGTIAWSSSLSLAPGEELDIIAPVPADPTLASVRVMAYADS